MIMGREGFEVPLSIGFRGITAFQGKSEAAPSLYAPTWSTSKGYGPVLLRSSDGERFEQISEPGFADPTASTIRSIIGFKGKLFVSPTGKPSGHLSANIPDKLLILVSEDPAKGHWKSACMPHFGDATNEGVFNMAAYNGFLYAGTINTSEGCQIWKTDAEGSPPYDWKKVFSQGGFRGKNNEGILHMVGFEGRLYVGTGIVGGGYDRVRNIGPASAELLRLNPDDTWDLVVGEPRHTPQGWKVPLSGMGPGFNRLTTGYFWRLCVHQGWLYLGTYNAAIWFPYLKEGELPDHVVKAIEEAGGIDSIVEKAGGFDLWRSKDGVDWIPVSRNGFGNPCNYGVRTMESTPYGLFLGAANPFGPTMAVKRLSGWRYVHNARGGLEIWLGSHRTSGELSAGAKRRIDLVRPFSRETKAHDERYESWINAYYDNSDFRHCGLWRYPVRHPIEACENLVEELVSFLPHKKGRLLEIGCGKGATTRSLLKHFSAHDVTAITQRKSDLEVCRRNAPLVEFRSFKAVRQRFRKSFFDYVISLEGLDGTGNERSLFQDLHRILKPNGLLVFSSFLYDFSTGDKKRGIDKTVASTPAGYRKLLEECGFEDTEVFDATELCWVRFKTHYRGEFEKRLLKRQIREELYQEIVAHLPGGGLQVSHYIIVKALKKQEQPRRFLKGW
jgi:cyclopropane fatty-acyl-phospholipid synthase-like methyltransferase